MTGAQQTKIVNGKQMTTLWHVDDAKASHEKMEASEEFADCLRGTHDDEEIGAIKVNCGPRHDFLGMTLDHSKKGKLTVDVIEHIKKMIEDFEKKNMKHLEKQKHRQQIIHSK